MSKLAQEALAKVEVTEAVQMAMAKAAYSAIVNNVTEDFGLVVSLFHKPTCRAVTISGLASSNDLVQFLRDEADLIERAAQVARLRQPQPIAVS